MRTESRPSPAGDDPADAASADLPGAAEPDAGVALPAARRGFLLAAGTAATGLLSGAATGSPTGSDRVVVETTRPYLPAAREWARAAERSTGASLRLRRTDRETAARLRDGRVDAHLSGRPTLPALDVAGGRFERATAVHGAARLRYAGEQWHEPLTGRQLRERWTADAPVETWVESEPRTAAAVEQELGRPDRENAVPTALVRGTRSYQYARGAGGAGYYEVDRDDVRVRSGRVTTAVPVVRLGFLAADAESLGRDLARSLVEAYDGNAPAVPAALADPPGE